MPKRPKQTQHGFALVVTVSLMILLSLLAVGLLSLSSISLRTSTQGKAISEARANARLGLMLALGELQKQLGPDQRISASAGILGTPGSEADDVANGHWVGVWDSWVGENRYIADQHDSSSLVPDISDNRSESFRKWLVSSADPNSLEDLDLATGGVPDEAIQLIGPGTIGQDADSSLEVWAPRVLIADAGNDPAGAYSWWVADQSQKGLVRAGRDEGELSKPVEVVSEGDSPSSIAEELYAAFTEPADEQELEKAVISRRSLDFLSSVAGADELGALYHELTIDARSVLADVREGGLKRDLNLMAERYEADFDSRRGLPVEEETMLYEFDELHRVPLHDLLTYYSLYKARPTGSSRGVLASDGRSKPYTSYISTREWSSGRDSLTTNLYRQPVLLKTQLSIWARAERSGGNPGRPYRLKIRFSPIITLWNPYSVPLVLNDRSGDGMRIDILGISADFAVWPNYERGNDRGRESSSLGGLTTGSGDDVNTSEVLASMIIRDRVQFAPGEVRVFSLDQRYDSLAEVRELKPGYWPISGNEADYYDIRVSRGGAVGADYDSDNVTFTADQIIGVGFAGGTEDAAATDLKFFQGASLEVRPDYPGRETSWRTQALYSRRSPDRNPSDRTADEMNQFNQLVFELGSLLDGEEMPFRTGTGKYIRKPYSIRNLESPEGEMVGVFTYGVAGENEVLGYRGRRQPRFPCRPFLHSLPTVGSPWIQDLTTAALYNLGWAWRIEDGQESSNEIVVDGQRGRYGGGWSAAYGQDRVVQYEIPQRPFFSLAQFSNAALGGWSIARNHPTSKSSGLNAHETTTAHGQGGLFPAWSMAVGNSYASPFIPRDQAVSSWNMRKYHGAERSEPYVDHSYLANHALWDEFFMSSIADQERGLHVSEDFPGRAAVDMLEGFFGPDRVPLPNRRFRPATGLPWDEIKGELYRGSRPDDSAHEAIARYLLLEGGFNVNSTSVEAWETLLGSLRGKPGLSIPGDSDALSFDLVEHEGETPVSGFSIATAGSTKADSPLRSDGFAPEQWVGSFTLSDAQVRELAEAIVGQVKERGPFLSLSDFVNRRLDSDVDLAKWGALQAAIDEAGLNAPVDSGRTVALARRSEFLREQGVRVSDPIPFPEAGEGPVIQGSAAYIDQADILRAIDSQLMVRGDTYVVRACGESLDADGGVKARAYCEAVVQRTPDYLSAGDDPETRTEDLENEINRKFGRVFRLVSFRWLPLEEV